MSALSARLPGRLAVVPAEEVLPGVIYHPDHVALMELDGAALSAWRRLGTLGEADTEALDEDLEVLAELLEADLLRDPSLHNPPRRAPDADKVPLRALVLNVTQNCNLSCTYCFSDVLSPAAEKRVMTRETAFTSVDTLLRESGALPRVSLSFLGGEPLMVFPLVKEVLLYAEEAAARAGKEIHFSLTTNGTTLTPEIVEALDAHRVSVTVSLDGPPEIHDRHRPTAGGKGSFARLEPRVRHLLATMRSRPVAARVTLTRGSGSILPIFEFLKRMGFYDVGFSPVSDRREDLRLDDAEMERLLDDFTTLRDRYVDLAVRGIYPGFSNLSNLLAEIHRGQARTHACGAGLGLLGTDWKGGLYLCHRFSGQQDFRLGSVQDGVDQEARKTMTADLALESRPDCQACWVRHMCAGGCYHEAVERSGDPRNPRLHGCDSLRRWIRLGLQSYVDLHRRAPAFLEKLSGSRRDESTGAYH